MLVGFSDDSPCVTGHPHKDGYDTHCPAQQEYDSLQGGQEEGDNLQVSGSTVEKLWKVV